ncbi:MAG: alpha/beta hydrolase [Methylacidiphilales bacterium]|nr:alpha/beta hydrolase [Candidatus Methylacidiphilales bacterium]
MPILKSSCALFTFLTLLSLSIVPAQTNAPALASATPPGVVALHDVVIGKGGARDLHAEVAYPVNATGLLPAVIFIHGGGWAAGSHKQSPVYELAQNGYFAASIEYRLSKEAKWPAQIQDCMLGVRWLRANAAQYHVDPNRIGVWGASAGGHLVACVGTMTDVKEYQGDGGYPGVSSAVQAVVDYFGPTDFTDPASNPPRTVGQHLLLFGVPYAQNPALWKSASPLFYVKAGDPPMLIAHGDADVTVPIAQSIMFDAALTKAGVPHQFIVVKNGGHGFSPLPGTTLDPNSGEIKKALYDFLAKYLKAP